MMNTTEEILEDIRSGKMVILIDDENRENEGDLILAADFVTPQAINFMAKEARGLICLSLPGEQLERLGVPLMVKEDSNSSPNKTAFTLSIEASHGVSTGISAADRAHTIRVASNPLAKPSDVSTPGHIFPIRAREGGVLKRAGHTEASVDLAKLAGLNPAAVICEIMNADGTMARTPELVEFARKHDLKIGTIEQLIEYRLRHESFVEEKISTRFETAFGDDYKVKLFVNTLDGTEHLAFVKGDISGEEPVLVRVHTENILGDVFGSALSSSRSYLEKAFAHISREGRGVVLYLRMESTTDRLEKRLKALSAIGKDPSTLNQHRLAFSSDQKDYGVGAQILRTLGLKKIILLSNNTAKRVGLKGYGIEIVDSIGFVTSGPDLTAEKRLDV